MKRNLVVWTLAVAAALGVMAFIAAAPARRKPPVRMAVPVPGRPGVLEDRGYDPATGQRWIITAGPVGQIP